MNEYMETKAERIARDVEEAARKLSTFANNAKIKRAYQHELLDIVDALLVAVRS